MRGKDTRIWLLAPCVAATACRDRLLQPFDASSIWNTAIGSGARYAPADLYPPPPPPTPGQDGCTAGRANPSRRGGCPGWQPTWHEAECLAAGCCYDPHPNPDPSHYPWCYSNSSLADGGPARFYVDIDYFIQAGQGDPLTPVVEQGWWGDDPECGYDHCCVKSGSSTVAVLPFPAAWTVNMTSNNAAALLLPDNETLVQFQPLVRCTPGSPIFGLARQFLKPGQWPRPTPTNESILGQGTWGAHGGSRLSSIGGTVRKGELLPGAPPIAHALKLMLWAAQYYWPGEYRNGTSVGSRAPASPCYRWPALTCDGGAGARPGVAPCAPGDPNYYNGTEPALCPGALLAIPPQAAAALAAPGTLVTGVGQRLLPALLDYGGYLDDNTASDSGAFNVEGGVVDEVQAAYGVDLRHVAPGSDLYADLRALFRALHIVDNNSNATRGGGGTPRQPPAPPICGAS